MTEQQKEQAGRLIDAMIINAKGGPVKKSDVRDIAFWVADNLGRKQ